MLRIPRSRRSIKSSRLPEIFRITFRYSVHNFNHVRIAINAVIELVPQNRLHLGRSRRYGKPQSLITFLRFDFKIESCAVLHFAVTRRTISTFRHQANRPTRSWIRQFVRCVIAPLVSFALVIVRVIAKASVAIDRRLFLHNATELDRHLPCRIWINAHQVVPPALRRPVARRNVTVRAISDCILAFHLIQHGHTRMPAIQIAPAIVRSTSLELIIAPGLFVQSLLCWGVLKRGVLHRELAKLIIQLFQRPAINHHHRTKRSLFHATVFAIANRFHPDAVDFVSAFIATAKFLLQMFQELPIAITVARRTVIEVRIIDQVFCAMGIIRIELMRHPVCMRFCHPA